MQLVPLFPHLSSVRELTHFLFIKMLAVLAIFLVLILDVQSADCLCPGNKKENIARHFLFNMRNSLSVYTVMQTLNPLLSGTDT